MIRFTAAFCLLDIITRADGQTEEEVQEIIRGDVVYYSIGVAVVLMIILMILCMRKCCRHSMLNRIELVRGKTFTKQVEKRLIKKFNLKHRGENPESPRRRKKKNKVAPFLPPQSQTSPSPSQASVLMDPPRRDSIAGAKWRAAAAQSRISSVDMGTSEGDQPRPRFSWLAVTEAATATAAVVGHNKRLHVLPYDRTPATRVHHLESDFDE